MGAQRTCGHNGWVTTEETRTLEAADGVRLHALHRPADGADPRALGIVVVHGFTNHSAVPRVQHVLERLHAFGGVVALDMRGHGRSAAVTTLGDAEVLDVDAAVEWARELGYRSVVTVGFSMGGSVVVRQAALGEQSVDAVVSVSAPAFWYYRGTRVMRLLHHVVERPAGRAVMRMRGVRITSQEWTEPLPMTPEQAAAQLDATPLLVVHGTIDHYFPIEHAHAIHRAATSAGNPNTDLWIVEGFAHAESGISDETLDDIGRWASKQTGSTVEGS